ncbi:UNVERIFIED_CONTAM: hypothetical protein Sradi_3144100 [Sesamum radiatum]|uniref:Integrase catalytic domain-containing protein n=1 Tax=Sesamum radiatum TaxID=300843 RepID=A0AAW2RFQ1_SESRA
MQSTGPGNVNNASNTLELIHIPAEPLRALSSPCPFSQWGIDIVGPFPVAAGQRKFLLVAIDYVSKWIEAKPLARITKNEVIKFLWKNIICRCLTSVKNVLYLKLPYWHNARKSHPATLRARVLLKAALPARCSLKPPCWRKPCLKPPYWSKSYLKPPYWRNTRLSRLAGTSLA